VRVTCSIVDVALSDMGRVGGKNASLGELFRALKPKGVGVLDGSPPPGKLAGASLARPQVRSGGQDYWRNRVRIAGWTS